MCTENKTGIDEESPPLKEYPVCHSCFQAMMNGEYYCQNCGQGASDTAPFIPFVNIQHQANFFGAVWRRLLKSKSPLVYVIIFFALGSLWGPVIFLLPVFLYSRWKLEKKNLIKDGERFMGDLNKGKGKGRTKGKLARMVRDMLEREDLLSETELKWVQDIVETAAEFERFDGYTPRQEEVLRDIFKRFKVTKREDVEGEGVQANDAGEPRSELTESKTYSAEIHDIGVQEFPPIPGHKPS